MLRALFLLLLLINLAYFGWHWTQAPEEAEDTVAVPGIPPGDSPLFPPAVVPELDLTAQTQAGDPARLSPWQCSQAGPFQDPAAARLLAASGGLPLQPLRREQQTVLATWWVFLPADNAAQLDTDTVLQRLEQAGDTDFYRIAEGEHAGGLSFGLFTSPDRAESRQAELAELGIDARIQPRTAEQPVYWVVLTGPPHAQRLPSPEQRDWVVLPALCPPSTRAEPTP